MTTPGRDRGQPDLAPVRRRGGSGQARPFDDDDVARGQSDALLGALGRMQLRLDLLAREQAETFDRILVSLEHIDTRLAALEVVYEQLPYEEVPETTPQP